MTLAQQFSGALRKPGWALVFAGAAGIGHAMSFAPVAWWWGQVLALSALAWLLMQVERPRLALACGFAFGLGWFGAGVNWLYTSMHVYGEMAAPLAAAALVLFCALIALFPALAAWGFWGLRARLAPQWHAWAFALCWSAGEWLRANVFTGFPWIAAGYAHVDGPLAGYAPLGGIHALNFLAAGLAGMLTGLVCAPHIRSAAGHAALALCIIAGGWALKPIAWTHPAGAPIGVRLLQGNVAQDTKFREDNLAAQYALYYRLATEAPADLIVLPETALPLPIQQSPPGVFDALAQFAHDTSSTIVTGVFILETDPLRDEVSYTNAAVAIGPDAPTPITDHTRLPSYRKYHLVPFGEFIPPGLHWFVDMMTIPIGDQARGQVSQASIAVPRRRGAPARVGLNICYEDYFGDEVAVELQRDDAPQILLNLTNIAWFGDSGAIPQHLLASRMRAIETGRPMLRATNTGATAVIGPDGRVQARLAPFTMGSLAATVQGMDGMTPYARWLDRPFEALCIGGLLMLGWLARRPRAESTIKSP